MIQHHVALIQCRFGDFVLGSCRIRSIILPPLWLLMVSGGGRRDACCEPPTRITIRRRRDDGHNQAPHRAAMGPAAHSFDFYRAGYPAVRIRYLYPARPPGTGHRDCCPGRALERHLLEGHGGGHVARGQCRPAGHRYPDPGRHADRRVDRQRHGTHADLLRPRTDQPAALPGGGGPAVRRRVRVPRHLLGHRRHGGPGPDGDRGGVRHPGLLDRRRRGLGRLLRRQGVPAVGYHQSGASGHRRESLRSHSQPGPHHPARHADRPVIYLLAGFNLVGDESASLARIASINNGLSEHFMLSWWTVLPVVLVIGMAVMRLPAIPVLFAGVILGGLAAMGFQGAELKHLFAYAFSGYEIATGVAEIDGLLNRGGIQSMTWVITLLLIALSFGGVLESTGSMRAILDAVVKRIRSFGSLQTSAIGSSMVTNVVAGDPYLSIALTGRMFGPAYRGMGYSMLNLSRATEEGGTLVSPLVPWNAGGAVVITSLGLGVYSGNPIDLLYIPLAFACWLSPLIGILYGWTGWFSPLASDQEKEAWAAQGEEVMEFESWGKESARFNSDIYRVN